MSYILFFLLGNAIAGGLVVLAYFLEVLSWTGVSIWANLFLFFVFTVALIQTFAGLIRNAMLRKRLISGFMGFWMAAFFGVLYPGLVGETPAWGRGIGSVIYQFAISEMAISEKVLLNLNNPLRGERSTLNYLAATKNGGAILVSSPGTEFLELDEAIQSRADARAIISSLNSDGSLLDWVDVTEVEPSVRLVRGIFLDEASSTLYLSSVPAEGACFGLQLWTFEIALDALSLSRPKLLFQMDPCLETVSGAERFGGRIAKDSEGNIYLSVGDFGNGVSTVREEQLEGVFEERPAIMNEPHSVGTIVGISPSGRSWVKSRGHRNPQGLYWDSTRKALWESEHGPKGGDEVNLILDGKDYGWPDVTYGGPYGGLPQPATTWHLGRWYGSNHGKFEEPVFSWLPSIAASQLVVYEGDMFNAWQGDLLVSSFKGDIRRLRLSDDRVVLEEVISIGVRPRDLVVLSDGSLLISTDDSTLLRITLKG